MRHSNTLRFPFAAEKVTEVAAEFLRLAGGEIYILTLVKLVYLLDRESIAQRGVAVVGGSYLSMASGPVTSEVLDLINNGFLSGFRINWEQFISDRQDHQVGLKNNPGREHLSDVELELIERVFSEHQEQDRFELVAWCHANCGEWTPLDQGCADIDLERLAEEVGRDREEVIENALEQSFLDEAFQSK